MKLGIAQSPEGRALPAHDRAENLEMGAFQRNDRGGIKRGHGPRLHAVPAAAERRTQKAGTMSGGEQQMCAIGRALMARPKLLMLDEPSMGLAPIFVERIFETIVEMNKQGTSILLVEQNALMALDVANRGYVLETGKIALADDAKALRAERAGPQDVPRRGSELSLQPTAQREIRRREDEADRGARRPARAPCRAPRRSRAPARARAAARRWRPGSRRRAPRRAAPSAGWHRVPVAKRKQWMRAPPGAVGGKRIRVRGGGALPSASTR